ncbi:MAG TPA: hypothetical protein VFG68_01905 [Fimbriiglobus sp.]|nr:hypothetical protein [Fimbriiglobus sp.]
MLILGSWEQQEDGIERPILRGEVAAPDGSWVGVPFLVDTGADRTVISAPYYAALVPAGVEPTDSLVGIGGVCRAVILTTTIQLYTADVRPMPFRGQFRVFAEPDASEMSVLGRDILNLFAVVVDHGGRKVCLVRDRHRCVILEG